MSFLVNLFSWAFSRDTVSQIPILGSVFQPSSGAKAGPSTDLVRSGVQTFEGYRDFTMVEEATGPDGQIIDAPPVIDVFPRTPPTALHNGNGHRPESPFLNVFERGLKREISGHIPTHIAANIDRICNGQEVIVTHSTVGQSLEGREAGISGLSALNCAKNIMVKEKNGVIGSGLLAEIMDHRVMSDITSVCGLWTDENPIVVRDIFDLPFFSKFLSVQKTHNGVPTVETFTNLIMELPNQVCTLVIARTPEIVACTKIPTQRGNVFVIFDPYARPEYHVGAAVILNNNIRATADRLFKIFSIDPTLLESGDWQVQMLNSFTGYTLVPPAADQFIVDSEKLLIDLSLNLVGLQKALSKTNAQKENLQRSQEQLQNELEGERGQSREKLIIQAAQSERLLALEAHEKELNEIEKKMAARDQEISAQAERIRELETGRAQWAVEAEAQFREHHETMSAQVAEIEALTTQNQQLTSELQAHTEERDQTVAMLTTQLEDASSQNEELASGVNSLQLSFHEATSSHIAELAVLRGEKEKLQETAERQLQDKEHVILDLESRLDSLEMERDRIAEEYDNRAQSQDTLIATLTAKIQGLEQELENAQDEFDRSKREKAGALANATAQIEAFEAEKQKLIADHESRLIAAQKSVQAQRTKILNADAENKRLVAENASYLNQIATVSAEKQRLQREASDKGLKTDNLVSENQRLQNDLKSRSDRIDGLIGENQKLKNELQTHNRRLNDFGSEKERIQGDLRARASQIDLLTSENSQLQSELRMKATRIETLTTEAQRLQTDVRAANTRNETLNSEIKRLRTETDSRKPVSDRWGTVLTESQRRLQEMKSRTARR